MAVPPTSGSATAVFVITIASLVRDKLQTNKQTNLPFYVFPAQTKAIKLPNTWTCVIVSKLSRIKSRSWAVCSVSQSA
jgi:hypothetical protein